MFIFNTLLIGLREIFSHWFRSFLTIIGVVLGIMSLVTMSAIVQGMEILNSNLFVGIVRCTLETIKS